MVTGTNFTQTTDSHSDAVPVSRSQEQLVDAGQVALEVTLLVEHPVADEAGGLSAVQGPVVTKRGRRTELPPAEITHGVEPCPENEGRFKTLKQSGDPIQNGSFGGWGRGII